MSTATKDRATKVRKVKALPAAIPESQLETKWPEISDAPAKLLGCIGLARHPLNRTPSEASIDKLVDSLSRVGQLEPLIVRPLPGGDGDDPEYQILSGETRWRAAMQLRWTAIAARVVEMDDAQALLLVAEANEARKDLTTCERARLIQRLCLSPAEGGSGLTREQAGRLFGLESGAAASNLVKLLDAPEAWQRRLDQPDVDRDDDTVTIHQGTVREVAKFAALSPAVATALEAAYQEELRGGSTVVDQLGQTRDQQLQWVADVVHEGVRVLTEPRYYGYQHGGDHPCYLDLQDAELLARLEIVELPIGGKKGNDLVRCATNVKLFDQLQIAEIERRQRSKSKGGSVDKRAPATADLSPKERAKIDREKRKSQDEQLAKWVRDWKHRLLRAALSDSLDSDQAVWVLPWLMAAGSGSWRTPLADLLGYSIETSRLRWSDDLPANDRKRSPSSREQSDVTSLLELAEVLHHKCRSSCALESRACQQLLARLLLWPADSETREPKLIAAGLPEQLPYYDHAAIEQLARWADVSVAEAWRDGATDGSIERALIAELLQRHTTAQLTDLSEQLGVSLTAKGKAACVAELLAAHKPGAPLPLPQLLQDKPAKATSKAKR